MGYLICPPLALPKPNEMREGGGVTCDGLASIQSSGSSNTPSHSLQATKIAISSGGVVHLPHVHSSSFIMHYFCTELVQKHIILSHEGLDGVN